MELSDNVIARSNQEGYISPSVIDRTEGRYLSSLSQHIPRCNITSRYQSLRADATLFSLLRYVVRTINPGGNTYDRTLSLPLSRRRRRLERIVTNFWPILQTAAAGYRASLFPGITWSYPQEC